MVKTDDAVRNYLLAIREPEALKDDAAAQKLKDELTRTKDPVARLQLQHKIHESQQINPKRYEEDFVAHAKAWAESKGVSHAAFQAEGVPDAVLRRAGFSIPRGAGGRRRVGGKAGTRTRVNAQDVRDSIPKGTFTIKDVQDASGASTAVVRRIVQQEVDAKRVSEKGSDPNHRGPGRAPTLYNKA